MALRDCSPRPARRLARMLVLGAATLAIAALPLTAEAAAKPMTFSFAGTTAKIYLQRTMGPSTTSSTISFIRTKGQVDQITSTIIGYDTGTIYDTRSMAVTKWDSAPVKFSGSRTKGSRILLTGSFAEASYTYSGDYGAEPEDRAGQNMDVMVGYQLIEVGSNRVIAQSAGYSYTWPGAASMGIPSQAFEVRHILGNGLTSDISSVTACVSGRSDPTCPLASTDSLHPTVRLLAPMISGRRYFVRLWSSVTHGFSDRLQPATPSTGTFSLRLVRPVATVR